MTITVLLLLFTFPALQEVTSPLHDCERKGTWFTPVPLYVKPDCKAAMSGVYILTGDRTIYLGALALTPPCSKALAPCPN